MSKFMQYFFSEKRIFFKINIHIYALLHILKAHGVILNVLTPTLWE